MDTRRMRASTGHFPGVLQNNVFRSDPVLDYDETGNFFYLSLLVNTFCGDIWRSTNGGQTWTERSPDGAAHSGDKEWFTVDQNPDQHGSRLPVSVLDRVLACDSEDSAAPPMAGQHGRVRLTFLMRLSGEHSM